MHVCSNFHFLLMCCTGSCFIIIKIICRNRELGAVKEMIIFFFWHPVAMRRFLLVYQEKWFILISFIQPVNSKISCNIGDISVNSFANTILNKIRIIIFSLSWHYIPVIKSYRIRDQMPFTNNGSLVTCTMQNSSNSLLFVIECAMVINKAINMTVFTGKH